MQMRVQKENELKGAKHDTEDMSLTNEVDSNVYEIKIYRRRWLVLIVFMIFSAIYSMHGIHYVIIENIMVRYYNVSSLAIEMTFAIYGILYIILFFPASYVVYKLNLRSSCLIAAVGSCIASWIKLVAVSPDRFFLTLVGQALVACWFIIIQSAPITLAAHWFGPTEVATATAMGCFGMALGIAFFSFITPTVVGNHVHLDDVGNDLYKLTFGLAIANTIAAVLMVMFFQSEPPLTPSKSRALQKLHKTKEFNFIQPLRRLLKNKNFLLLWNAHGLNSGAFSAAGAVFNRVYVTHFENGERDVGRLTMTLMIVGTISSIIVGKFQDKTKKFKTLLVVLYTANFVAHVSFGLAVNLEIGWAVYPSVILLGFVALSYISSGYETCVEITYPEPESVSIATLNIAGHIYSFFLILIMNNLLNVFGTWIAQVCLSIALLIGLILTIFTKDIQNRQAAMKSQKHQFTISSN